MNIKAENESKAKDEKKEEHRLEIREDEWDVRKKGGEIGRDYR